MRSLRVPGGAVSRRLRLALAVLLLGGSLATGAQPPARTGGEDGASSLDVLVTSPRAGEPVFGEVRVEIEVLASEPVAELLVRLDGRTVGVLTEPPWELDVDFGDATAAHRLEVEAFGARGGYGRAVRETGALAIDERVDLELRQLYVTVTRGGERVLDLPRERFTVLDQGEEQRIVTFERGDVPLTALLLVDASSSMRGAPLAAAVSGAAAFVAGMRPLDEASLLLFSDHLLAETPFTARPEVLRRLLGPGAASAAGSPPPADLLDPVGSRAVEAGGGSAVNDHLYLAAERLEPRQGRRVVVLLSDGEDVESVLSMEDVLWSLRRSPALLYWIRLGGAGAGARRASSWRDPEEHRAELELLEQAVVESGGRVVPIAGAESAEEAFREILAELREQYVLGYYPSVRRDDGTWHEVRVRLDGVRGRGWRVRTREGYVDD